MTTYSLLLQLGIRYSGVLKKKRKRKGDVDDGDDDDGYGYGYQEKVNNIQI